MRKITATLAIGTAFVLSACGSGNLTSEEAVDYLRNNASYSASAVTATDEELRLTIGMTCEEMGRYDGNAQAVLDEADNSGADGQTMRAIIAAMVAATESACPEYQSDSLNELRDRAGMDTP
jgi:hypothetical protein